MDGFVFTPDYCIEDALAAHIQAEERAIMYAANTPTQQDWLGTEEGHIHNAILCNFVAMDPNITSVIMNRMFSACARKSDLKPGRPKVFKPGRLDGKYRRALRSYIVSKLVAKGLELPFDKSPPEYVAPSAETVSSTPVEKFIQLQRFEQWTHYKLPHSAWIIFTREDRTEMAKHVDSKGWEEEGVPCLKLEAYIHLRATREGGKLITEVLARAAAERQRQFAPPVNRQESRVLGMERKQQASPEASYVGTAV